MSVKNICKAVLNGEIPLFQLHSRINSELGFYAEKNWIIDVIQHSFNAADTATLVSSLGNVIKPKRGI